MHGDIFEEEYEEVSVRFFTPVDVHEMFREAIEAFGDVLADELKRVRGSDKLPRPIVNQLIRIVRETVVNDAYNEEELKEEVASLLAEAGVVEADEVAENTIAEWLERLKKILKKAGRKKKKKEEVM